MIPLTGLLLILALQLFFRIKSKKTVFKLNLSKSLFVIVLILIAAAGIRLPYFVHSYGMTNSDDAIPALMAKHISEGEVPPVYFYGQLYLGSLSEHFYALMITVLGYSFYLVKFSAYLFFVAFLIVQYLFVQELFSTRYAVLVSCFWCLPIGAMVNISFDLSRADSLVFLLGLLLIYLAYLITFKEKENLLPALGFLMGISFWTHQITIGYIITAFLILLTKYRFQVRKYTTLFLYSLVGVFPVIFMEVFSDFPLVRYLLGGSGDTFGGEKLERALVLSSNLISREPHVLRFVFMFFVLSGFIYLVSLSIKKKKFLPQSIYSLFFLVYMSIYLMSGFSQYDLNRYLYPLYFCIPIFLISSLGVMKSRIKYLFMAALILALFVSLNMKRAYADLLSIKEAHFHRVEVLTFMKSTQNRYWRGGFWAAYMLSALSGEEVVVDSYRVNRYYPYQLRYENETPLENFVFFRGADIYDMLMPSRFQDLLERTEVDFESKQIENTRLVYNIKNSVDPRLLSSPVPLHFPAIEILQTEAARGLLTITFRNQGIAENYGGYRIHFEIPGYSSRIRFFPLKSEMTSIKIPFPKRETIKIQYFLDYRGLPIPSSQGSMMYYPTPEELSARRNKVLFLTGLGPRVDVAEETLRIMKKNLKLEIYQSLNSHSKARLFLYSPFEFFDVKWYGNYSQSVKIFLNEEFVSEQQLEYGNNQVEFPLGQAAQHTIPNLLTLEFKYHSSFRHIPIFKTAALFDKIEIE